jgi:hypothetical protein
MPPTAKEPRLDRAQRALLRPLGRLLAVQRRTGAASTDARTPAVQHRHHGVAHRSPFSTSRQTQRRRKGSVSDDICVSGRENGVRRRGRLRGQPVPHHQSSGRRRAARGHARDSRCEVDGVEKGAGGHTVSDPSTTARARSDRRRLRVRALPRSRVNDWSMSMCRRSAMTPLACSISTRLLSAV